MAVFDSDTFPETCADETGCTEPATRGPFCAKHWNKMNMRRYRYGRTTLLARPTAEERFWNLVEKTDGCWLWLGTPDQNGYGAFHAHGEKWRAHRYSYTIMIGAIPDGLTIDHVCRTRLCVRPDHLEAVSPKTNSQRRSAVITHCPKGHEYTPENTGRSNGRRFCRICSRLASKLYERRKYAVPDDVVENKAKTHCPQGHEYSPENTYVHRSKRACRTCMTLNMRSFRGHPSNAPIGVPNAEKTHCAQGHEFTPENTYIRKNGARVCRTCGRERALRKYHANKTP